MRHGVIVGSRVLVKKCPFVSSSHPVASRSSSVDLVYSFAMLQNLWNLKELSG